MGEYAPSEAADTAKQAALAPSVLRHDPEQTDDAQAERQTALAFALEHADAAPIKEQARPTSPSPDDTQAPSNQAPAPAPSADVDSESEIDVTVESVAVLSASEAECDSPAPSHESQELDIPIEFQSIASRQAPPAPPLRFSTALDTPPPESTSAGRRLSLDPTVEDVNQALASGSRRRRSPGLRFLTSTPWLVAAGSVVFMITLLALALRGPRESTLVVTASQSDSRAPAGLRILIDGEIRCENLPCRIDSLDTGAHVLRAESSERHQLAEVEIELREGEQLTIPLLLLVGDSAAAASPAPAFASNQPVAPPNSSYDDDDGEVIAASEPDPPSSHKKARRRIRDHRSPIARAQTSSEPSPPAPENAPVDAPAEGGMGTLVIASEPSSIVLVDGQQRGWTPKRLSLAAGPHTVTVQHAEFGAQTADVVIMARRSTMLRFDLE